MREENQWCGLAVSSKTLMLQEQKHCWHPSPVGRHLSGLPAADICHKTSRISRGLEAYARHCPPGPTVGSWHNSPEMAADHQASCPDCCLQAGIYFAIQYIHSNMHKGCIKLGEK